MVKSGGSAFPTPAHNLNNDGMTLRDYFAAKVCAALCQYEEFPPAEAAERAYEYADEMLRHREKS